MITININNNLNIIDTPGLLNNQKLINCLDKRRLKEKIGELSPVSMQKVNTALMISLGFNDVAE